MDEQILSFKDSWRVVLRTGAWRRSSLVLGLILGLGLCGRDPAPFGEEPCDRSPAASGTSRIPSPIAIGTDDPDRNDSGESPESCS